ncbi:dTDP-4-dehydrorhamnose 3,5-epimerase family protein, partial [Gluconacetobacter entanii]
NRQSNRQNPETTSQAHQPTVLRSLHIPPGCAHGFMTLNDDVEVFYAMSNIYAQDHASGLRFDDPALGISWPRPVAHISAKDLQWPYYKGSEDMVW